MPRSLISHGRTPRPSNRAFTFVEMAVTLSILSIVLVSLGSVLVVTAKALPSAPGANAATVSADAALDSFMSDIRFATSVTEDTSKAFTFTVADRTGDSTPETIRYAWSGTPGDPLTRQYNGGAAVNVVPSVNSFNLSYQKLGHSTTVSTTTTWDSGEVLFSSFNGWSGVVGLPSTTNLTTASWAAEAFQLDKVAFPADTSRVSITRVQLKLKGPSSGTTGITVGIYLPSGAGASTPAASPIGTPFSLNSSTLTTSFAWVDSTFSDVTFPNGNTTNLVLVVKGVSGSTTGSLQYYNSILAPFDNSTYRYSTTSGATWLPASSFNANDALYFVYGSYQRPTVSNVTTTTYTLQSVAITLQPSGTASPRVDAAVETLNSPQLP